MLKRVFQTLGVIGFIIICVLAFVIPSNPNKIIYSITGMTPNLPLWFDIILCCSFIYEIILYSIYDKIKK